jgi:hypothetical protein
MNGRMSSGARRTIRAAHLGQWLFGLAVAGSALAVGAVHILTLCIVTGVLAIAMALVWWDAEPIRVRPVATFLLVVAVALTSYTAIQCVPLPAALLRHFAPYSASVWSRALSPLGEPGPAWAPLSLDPVATRIEVLKGVAYLLAFVTAVRIARRREGVALLSWVIMLTGLALAVAALLHPAFGVRKLYGLYEPSASIEQRHVAPLINPNNLAGYLNLALCLALAASLAPEPRLPRPVMAAVALLTAATQVWVASRGGVVTMILGAVLVIVIVKLLRSRARLATVNALSVFAGLAAAGGGVLIVLGESEAVKNELFSSDTSKLLLLRHVFAMLPSVAAFGCGRGAFESVYPAFRVDPGYSTFTHPENIVAQWVLEWGLVVGVAGLAAVVYALRPNAVLARSTTAAGAWAALVSFGTQNLGDLGTEIPGLMLGAVVCAAIVVGGTPGRAARWRIERWSTAGRKVVVTSVCAAGVSIGMVAAAGGRELHEEQHAIHDAAAENTQVTVAAMHSIGRFAMMHHPAEPYFPFAVALRAISAHDESVMPWIGATLERAGVYGPAHLVLARALARRSPSQSRLEYRLAMEQAPEFSRTIMVEAPRLVAGYDDATELVPEGPFGVQVLDALAQAIVERLPATVVRLDADILHSRPDDVQATIRAATGLVEDLEAAGGAPWCSGEQRAACLRRAMEATARAHAAWPRQCATYMLRARAQIAGGEVANALRQLEAAADNVDDRMACLQNLAALAQSAEDDESAARAIDKVVRAGCSDDAVCVQNLLWAADAEERRKETAKALIFYRRARDLAPENDGILEALATLASKAGLHVEAAENYRRLADRHPERREWRRAAQAERDEVSRPPRQP